jgi:hypothetical protein
MSTVFSTLTPCRISPGKLLGWAFAWHEFLEAFTTGCKTVAPALAVFVIALWVMAILL